MIASLRFIAVFVGVGIGSLTATVLALILWAVLASLGLDDAPLAALTMAVLVGFATSGYAAGRLSPHTHRFHGAVSGLGLAALVFFIAAFGGSPASFAQILGLLLLGIVLGALGGILGGRRRTE